MPRFTKLEVNGINTLGFAILSALGRKPCSGYELVQYLETIWPAKHSQIYPMLSKMEQADLLVYEHIEQTGRPDKKIYFITEKGKCTLAEWVNISPADPIHRDEFLIKVYSMWLIKKEDSMKLVQDRISTLEEKMSTLSNKITELEQNKNLDSMSKDFGRYILFTRKFGLVKEEKAWCQWVLELIKSKGMNMLTLGSIGAKKFSMIIENLVLSI